MEKKFGYIIMCLSYEIRGGGGSIQTKDGDEFWLSYDKSGGGYYQWYRQENEAFWFKSKESAYKTALSHDGMPYWCRIKPNTIKIYSVSKKVIVESSKHLVGEFE